MRWHRRVVAAYMVAATILSLFLPLSASAEQPAQDPAEAALTPRLKMMLQAMKIARERHVLKPENPQLIRGAIQGMLARLDPEAELYTSADLQRFERARGATRSVGIEVRKIPVAPRTSGPGFRIVSAADGSPAARAGLKPGDLISHVDGVATGELSSLDLKSNRVEGQDAGFVTLSIVRIGANGTPVAAFDIMFAREQAVSQVVLSELDGGIAVIRVAGFADAGRMIEQQLAGFRTRTGTKFRGVILDLRDAPGGFPEDAIAVADAFLDQGVITTAKARGEAADRTFSALPGDVAGGKPIVVLVNAGTGAAGEIITAALRDNKRATVIGTQTPGVANQQGLVMLPPERGAIAMTTVRYLSPSGARLDKGGIKPDKTVPAATAASGSAENPCRDVDRPESDGDGQCVRRVLVEDTVLRAALDHLNGASVGATISPPR